LGSGLAARAAAAITGDVQNNITAAGTTQGTATTVYGDNVIVTTCAAGAGVVLSTDSGFGPGDDVFVSNQGANACLVYPPSGAQINALGANAGFSVASTKSTFLRCVGLNASGVLQFYAMAAA
jgi:hypothetical protein